MRKELDYGDLFARWGKPGEKLDDEWREVLPKQSKSRVKL